MIARPHFSHIHSDFTTSGGALRVAWGLNVIWCWLRIMIERQQNFGSDQLKTVLIFSWNAEIYFDQINHLRGIISNNRLWRSIQMGQTTRVSFCNTMTVFAKTLHLQLSCTDLLLTMDVRTTKWTVWDRFSSIVVGRFHAGIPQRRWRFCCGWSRECWIGCDDQAIEKRNCEMCVLGLTVNWRTAIQRLCFRKMVNDSQLLRLQQF